MKWSGDVEYKETELKNIPSDWPVTSGTNEWSWMDQDPILPLVGCYAPLQHHNTHVLCLYVSALCTYSHTMLPLEHGIL